MNAKRPRINIPYEQVDIVVELLNIALLLIIWGYAIKEYLALPDEIPVHFNVKGEADAMGSKTMIWILPLIATFIFGMMVIINRFPHIHNYMVNITDENAFKNYRLSTRILRFVNLYCMLIFAVLIFDIVGLAKGDNAVFINGLFIGIIAVLPIGIVIAAIYLQKKINK